MTTVHVKTGDSAYALPTPTRTGAVWPPTSCDVEVSETPRAARPRMSMVVPRGGGRPHVWDGTRAGEYWLLLSAGTDSGLRAHPIAGVDRMSPGALQAAREHLGLTGDQMAAMLTNASDRPLGPRTLRDFEAGGTPVPEDVRSQVEELLQDTAGTEWSLVEALDSVGREERVVVVYRTDDELHEARPEYRRWPARWWRQVVARVAAGRPDVRIESAS